MASTRRSRRKTKRDAESASVRFDDGVTRYYRLYELLSAALQDGKIHPESALPSEPQLCARHGLSRTTVRRALDRLEREGRIVRRRGSGTYARPQEGRPRLSMEVHALFEVPAVQESRTAVTTLRFETAPVPQALQAIAAEIGATAYLLERLLSGSGRGAGAHHCLPAAAHRESFAATDPEPNLADGAACRPRAVGHCRRMFDGSGAGGCRCRASAASPAGLGSRQSPRGSDRRKRRAAGRNGDCLPVRPAAVEDSGAASGLAPILTR